MPANASVWTFQQLGGDQKTLVLADHAAPHGRPRKKPVVEVELEQRESTTRVAGNVLPVRHLFGTLEHDQSIEGRLSDARGGKDYARAKRREIESFVRDGQQVTITWDNLVGVVGLIKSVKFSLESGGEILYKIDYFVDQNLLSDVTDPIPTTPRGPKDMANRILRDIDSMSNLVKVPAMRGSIFDVVSGLIANVAAVTSALNSIAGQIDSFANAPFQLLNQLRAALDQFRTAVSALRKTYDDFEVNVALENDNASSWQSFFDVQAAWSASSLSAIKEALATDRAAALAQQGAIQSVYMARAGDTWEQISRIAYKGSADRARDIREANGVQPGSQPIPGTEYVVPT